VTTANLNHRRVRTVAAAAAAAIVVLLQGCAAPASRQGMTATAPQAGSSPAPRLALKQRPFSVSVTTSGGQATGAMDSSNVGNDDLKAAIEASIRDSKAFREVVDGPGGQYQLAVNIIQLNKPMFGMSFTVELEAGWSLSRGDDRQVVMRRVVRSSHTATMGDAFVGATRLRLALEGAVRGNIAQGLRAIDEAALPDTAGRVGEAQSTLTATASPAPAAAPNSPTAVAAANVAGATPAPVVPAREPPSVAVTAVAANPAPSLGNGTSLHTVERLAEARSCSQSPRAVLVAKGPGFETYSLPCKDGDAIVVRCEFGNCRMLR
jgi:hypothetical protein